VASANDFVNRAPAITGAVPPSRWQETQCASKTVAPRAA